MDLKWSKEQLSRVTPTLQLDDYLECMHVITLGRSVQVKVRYENSIIIALTPI